MDIEQMTRVSHYLLILSILFAITAIIIFFVLDIPRCWNMVFGTHRTKIHILKSYKKTHNKKEQEKENFGRCSKETRPLSTQNLTEEETVLLHAETEETILLDTDIEKQESEAEKAKEETVLIVSNIEKQKLKETEKIQEELPIRTKFTNKQKLAEEETTIQGTILLSQKNALCSNDRSKPTDQLDIDELLKVEVDDPSELTRQLDGNGMIFIQDIVCMYENSTDFLKME